MATYEEIYGKRVEVLDADPTLTSAYEGQVWYNSATGTLRTVVSFAAWSSATPLTTARFNSGGCGTQTAAIVAGGNPAADTVSQQYNGTTWATAASLSTGRDNNAYCSKTSGSQTGFIAGGYSGTANTGATEEYNAETTAVNVKTLTQS